MFKMIKTISVVILFLISILLLALHNYAGMNSIYTVCAGFSFGAACGLLGVKNE